MKTNLNSKYLSSKRLLQVARLSLVFLSTILRVLAFVLVLWAFYSLFSPDNFLFWNKNGAYGNTTCRNVGQTDEIGIGKSLADFKNVYEIFFYIQIIFVSMCGVLTIGISVSPYYLQPIPCGRLKMIYSILPNSIVLLLSIIGFIIYKSFLVTKFRNFCFAQDAMIMAFVLILIDIAFGLIAFFICGRRKKSMEMNGKSSYSSQIPQIDTSMSHYRASNQQHFPNIISTKSICYRSVQYS